MCGIVGAVAKRDIVPVLIKGLKRLEYRGYDSAGCAILNGKGNLQDIRVLGKVQELEQATYEKSLQGSVGIAHTRWATHGKVNHANAHPHVYNSQLALVHNGIIENHQELKKKQQDAGYKFQSETDSEVVLHQIYDHLNDSNDLLAAMTAAVKALQGSYALGAISKYESDRIIVARLGSPLVIGLGEDENFLASDSFALLPETRKFIYLEDGDIADIKSTSVVIYNKRGMPIERPIVVSETNLETSNKAGFKHYMLKEIFEQPVAIADTLHDNLQDGMVREDCFGKDTTAKLNSIDAVQIVACGTSYHAGLVAQYWMRAIAGLPCNVDVASEYRYRPMIAMKQNTLFIAISQSGETADTLAALRLAKDSGYVCTLSICNVADSSLTRESELLFITRAGIEISVASTKAFTTQLVALLLLILLLARSRGMSAEKEREITASMEMLPGIINSVLERNDYFADIAKQFISCKSVLYLGRGDMLPIAMEGALKLKEISYIHAESYPAGELKHGPLALVDDNMPVIIVAPNSNLLEKLKSNLYEVQARGGKLYVVTDTDSFGESDNMQLFLIRPVEKYIAPIVYTIPLQIFAYHIAVMKGLDVDQPRNLAKSVTVE